VNVIQNFIGFDGRIGRQSWWLGLIVIVIAYMIVSLVLSSLVGASMFSMMSNPEAMMEPGVMEALMQKTSWLGLILLAIVFYPATALTSKRLNDRDRPNWLKWLFWVPSVLGALANVSGLGFTTMDIGGTRIPTPSALSYGLSILGLIALIWWLVECGFLRGTDGTNAHGADPIAE
jgi:uncharacterized membrane protein YhaH (DUF805 family)